MATLPYCCLVPAEAVGLIVGRGGATIRQIQQDSGAVISISTEEDTPQALSDRVVAVQGEVRAKADAFKEILVRLFQTQGVEGGDFGIFVLIVPATSIGFIIGPKGTTITGIMEATSADISISRTCIDGTDLQPISISGDLRQSLDAAMQIGSHLETLAEKGRLEGVVWPPRCVRREQRSGARSRSITPGMRSAHTDSASSGVQGARSRSTTPPVAAHRRPSPQASVTPAYLRSGHSVSQDDMLGGYEKVTRVEPRMNSKSPAPVRHAPQSVSPRLAKCELKMSFLVDAPVAAWIVGKKGKMIEELRTKSGAAIEVEKHGGATRSVDLQGTFETIEIVIDLLLDCIYTFPSGAPSDIMIKVPISISDSIIGKTVRDMSEGNSGIVAEIVALVGGFNERIVRLHGSRQAVTQACHDISICFTESDSNASHRGSAQTLDINQTFSKGAADMDFPGRQQSGSQKQNEARLLKVGSFLEARSQAVGPVGQTPSEAQLLKVLMSGSVPNQARLQLVLPSSFVRHVLIGQGREAAVSERSGSMLELNRGNADDAGSQIVTLTGQMLGNAMAALYIQELLMQYD